MSQSTRSFVPSTNQHSAWLSAPPITVVTYNLLAQKYMGKHSYCLTEHSSWESRWPKIEHELKEYKADLLFLQEVEEPVFYDQLAPMLRAQGMQGFFRPRLRPGHPLEGEALFYQTACFDCLRTHIIGFADSAPAAAQGFWKEVRASLEGAVLTLLLHKQTNRVILAGSVHLYYNPQLPDIKLAQAAALCGEAVRLMAARGLAPADVPTILGGDWNSLWRKYRPDQWDPEDLWKAQRPPGGFLTSGVHHMFQHGWVDRTHHEHPAVRHGCADTAPHQFTTCGLQLHSAYAAGNNQQEPPLTTKTPSFKGVLDYIFVSVAHWAVTHTLSMPYTVVHHHAHFGPIPDAHFPSDHLAMGCKIALTE